MVTSISQLDSVIENGLVKLSVESMINLLGQAYSQLINAILNLRTMPSVMLWSSPGIGKSQGVRQLASFIAQRTERKAVVTDVRLLLFNPVDLRGIPVADAKRELAIWLKPKIFAMDAKADVINLLFLDEISAAPPSVQAAAYQITLDRTVGEHRLPENCIVIAAGNSVTDRSVAWKMPLALANRLCHLEIIADIDSWRHWALQNKIAPQVLGYLARRPDQLLVFQPEDDQLAFPSPRTWEMVSNILQYSVSDLDAAFPLICGCLGYGAATEFRVFCNVFASLPTMEDIFSGTCKIIPKQPDALYALTSAMSVYASLKRDDLQAIEHSLNYAVKLPPEFSTLLIRDYLSLTPDYKERLIKMPAFSRWIKTTGKYL